MQHLVCTVLVGAAVALTACQRGAKTEAASAREEPAAHAKREVSAAAMTEAKEIFAMRCTPCHGPRGAGDGPASAGLTPKPRNFQDPAWQKSVSDEHIEKIIQYGGAAVGRSPAMPPNPDLSSKPEVLAALRVYIRGLTN